MTAYAALAAVYDDWQTRYGSFSTTVLTRLAPLLAAEHDARSFLDVGCGTGQLLLEIAERNPGWRLAGLDASMPMLREARRKPGAERISWHALPLGAPVPGPPFDVVGAFFNTLNHVDDVSALGEAFGALAAALRPGGLLAFDVNNALGFEAWWRGARRYEGPWWTLEIASEYDATAARATAQFRVTVRGEVRESQLVERLFSPSEIEETLRAAGFVRLRSEAWAPLPDGVPGATFWTARRARG